MYGGGQAEGGRGCSMGARAGGDRRCLGSERPPYCQSRRQVLTAAAGSGPTFAHGLQQRQAMRCGGFAPATP
jgi:hypothetical protein